MLDWEARLNPLHRFRARAGRPVLGGDQGPGFSLDDRIVAIANGGVDDEMIFSGVLQMCRPITMGKVAVRMQQLNW